jgi:hypothetical protein
VVVEEMDPAPERVVADLEGGAHLGPRRCPGLERVMAARRRPTTSPSSQNEVTIPQTDTTPPLRRLEQSGAGTDRLGPGGAKRKRLAFSHGHHPSTGERPWHNHP